MSSCFGRTGDRHPKLPEVPASSYAYDICVVESGDGVGCRLEIPSVTGDVRRLAPGLAEGVSSTPFARRGIEGSVRYFLADRGKEETYVLQTVFPLSSLRHRGVAAVRQL